MRGRIIPIAALAAVLLAQACNAAPVYKVVGADGKVTFTDHPPAAANIDAPIKGTAAPKSGAGDENQVAEAARAAVKVYVALSIIEASTQFCIDNAPNTARQVIAARNAARARNAELSEKKDLVLLDTIGATRLAKVASNSRGDNERAVADLRRGGAAETQRICEALPKNMESAQLDPSRDTALVRSVMGYQLKQH